MKTMVTSLAILLIVGIAAIIIILNNQEDNNEVKSIDKIVEYSYETPEITTDLEDGSFVRIQFQILTDSKPAKEEISKRDFQLKNILIKELGKMEEEDFKTGLSTLEDEVKVKLNDLMTEGKIEEVYTINKILQ